MEKRTCHVLSTKYGTSVRSLVVLKETFWKKYKFWGRLKEICNQRTRVLLFHIKSHKKYISVLPILNLLSAIWILPFAWHNEQSMHNNLQQQRGSWTSAVGKYNVETHIHSILVSVQVKCALLWLLWKALLFWTWGMECHTYYTHSWTLISLESSTMPFPLPFPLHGHGRRLKGN